jgi:glutathione S-transferase
MGAAYYFENIIKPKYLGLPPDPRTIEGAEDNFHRYAKVLDDVLASRRWLIEDRLTYADFRAATIMPFANEAKMPVDGYKNILGLGESARRNRCLARAVRRAELTKLGTRNCRHCAGIGGSKIETWRSNLSRRRVNFAFGSI